MCLQLLPANIDGRRKKDILAYILSVYRLKAVAGNTKLNQGVMPSSNFDCTIVKLALHAVWISMIDTAPTKTPSIRRYPSLFNSWIRDDTDLKYHPSINNSPIEEENCGRFIDPKFPFVADSETDGGEQIAFHLSLENVSNKEAIWWPDDWSEARFMRIFAFYLAVVPSCLMVNSACAKSLWIHYQ